MLIFACWLMRSPWCITKKLVKWVRAGKISANKIVKDITPSQKSQQGQQEVPAAGSRQLARRRANCQPLLPAAGSRRCLQPAVGSPARQLPTHVASCRQQEVPAAGSRQLVRRRSNCPPMLPAAVSRRCLPPAAGSWRAGAPTARPCCQLPAAGGACRRQPAVSGMFV